MNKRAYQKSNEDIYRDYVDLNRKDFQNMNCHILMNRLNNGDISALETLRKIEVVSMLSDSKYSQPINFPDIMELYYRSNQQVYNDYESTESLKIKTRDCNLIIYRSLNGDKDALEKLKLMALDELIGVLRLTQASDALASMN